jgi:2,4-dienoyl-CoA reductase-like NADH-dependent reductase (Old Yellow Enzyme family)
MYTLMAYTDECRWGEGKNNFGVIVTGNIDIDPESVGGLASPIIPADAPFEGERFEKFKQMAAAAKKDGSLFVAQVNHPGRQVPYKINPVAISASDVQLGQLSILQLSMTIADFCRTQDGNDLRQTARCDKGRNRPDH